LAPLAMAWHTHSPKPWLDAVFFLIIRCSMTLRTLVHTRLKCCTFKRSNDLIAFRTERTSASIVSIVSGIQVARWYLAVLALGAWKTSPFRIDIRNIKQLRIVFHFPTKPVAWATGPSTRCGTLIMAPWKVPYAICAALPLPIYPLCVCPAATQ